MVDAKVAGGGCLVMLVGCRRWRGAGRGEAPDRRMQAEAHYELGVMYHERVFESLDLAIAEYEKSVKMKPDYAEAHYNLALSYHTKAKLGTDDKALYRKASAEYKLYLKYSPQGAGEQGQTEPQGGRGQAPPVRGCGSGRKERGWCALCAADAGWTRAAFCPPWRSRSGRGLLPRTADALTVFDESTDVTIGREADPEILKLFGYYDSPISRTTWPRSGSVWWPPRTPDSASSSRWWTIRVSTPWRCGGLRLRDARHPGEMNDEAQLAGILGHEATHVNSRHGPS